MGILNTLRRVGGYGPAPTSARTPSFAGSALMEGDNGDQEDPYGLDQPKPEETAAAPDTYDDSAYQPDTGSDETASPSTAPKSVGPASSKYSASLNEYANTPHKKPGVMRSTLGYLAGTFLPGGQGISRDLLHPGESDMHERLGREGQAAKEEMTLSNADRANRKAEADIRHIGAQTRQANTVSDWYGSLKDDARQQKQTDERDKFTKGGGQFEPDSTDLDIEGATSSVNITPKKQPIIGPEKPPEVDDLPDTGVMRRTQLGTGEVKAPNPMRKGYFLLPSVKGDEPGTRRVMPTPGQKAQETAEAQGREMIEVPPEFQYELGDKATRQQILLAQKNAKTKKDKEDTDYWIGVKNNPASTPQDIARATSWLKDKASQAQQMHVNVHPAPPLTPEALKGLSTHFLKTGMVPNLGRDSANNRVAIINAAFAGEGEMPDVGTLKAQYQADTAALRDLTKRTEFTDAFEQLARANLDRFVAQAQNVVDTGIVPINHVFRGASRAFGDGPQAAFDAARITAYTEVSKVLNNPAGAGQLSDSARHEAESVLRGDYTLEQLVNVSKLLKTEMADRTKFNRGQIGIVQDRIAKLGKVIPPEAPATPPAAPPQASQPPAPEAVKPIEKRHRVTKEFIHSLDNGVTWKPGRAPTR